MPVLIALAVVVLIVVAWAVRAYNRLVGVRNTAEEAWAGIDVQLQRRADLVPNLVETVKGYAGHERGALEAVVQARNALAAASGPQSSGDADDRLEGALRQLFAVAEAYPDLKASSSFLQLQRDLAAIEEELSFSRRYYNAVVEELNTAIQRVPTVVVARTFNFREREYFKAAAPDRAAPTVDLT